MNPKLEKLIGVPKGLWQRTPGTVRTFAARHPQSFTSILILTIAATAFLVLRSMREPPVKEQAPPAAPLVEVEQIKRQDIPIIVTGYGTARAKVEVEIVPQVSGKVVSLNPDFRAGDFIPAGEEILKIDPRDYELSVRQAEAGVADARVNLDMEKAEAAVALDEWRQLHPGTEPNSPLVLREPQIRRAKAALESAKAALDTAKLNLERTSVKLPIDVRIVGKSVDLGQFVTAGQAVGSAYGTRAVEIDVPLEDKELSWFDIPDPQINFNSLKGTKGSEVLVKADFAGKEHTWRGYVKRTAGQVDPKSRLVSVIVEVPHPFDTSGSKAPLLPGLFVETQIQGDTLEDAFAVPRYALRDDNKVWVVNNDKLYIKELKIARKDKEFAYVVGGLNDNEKIITSSLDVAVDGMSVRVRE